MVPACGALWGDWTRCQEPQGRVPVTLLQADTSSCVARICPPTTPTTDIVLDLSCHSRENNSSSHAQCGRPCSTLACFGF